MTPLAHRFAKELTLPLRDRRINDQAGLLKRLDQVHTFDCTAIWDCVDSAVNEENMWSSVRAILPETRIPCDIAWLESSKAVARSNVKGLDFRSALVVEKDDDWLVINQAMKSYSNGFEPYAVPLCRVRVGSPLESNGYGIEIDHMRSPNAQPLIGKEKVEHEVNVVRFVTMAVLLLDIINQPTLCHLKVHQPHRGLEKKLLSAGAGRYPLLAWHEVIIKPQDRPLTRQEIDGHLTGRKCLHFVRGHPRTLTDRDVWVKHHWKGDPALGIKRTRYKVKP